MWGSFLSAGRRPRPCPEVVPSMSGVCPWLFTQALPLRCIPQCDQVHPWSNTLAFGAECSWGHQRRASLGPVMTILLSWLPGARQLGAQNPGQCRELFAPWVGWTGMASACAALLGDLTQGRPDVRHWERAAQQEKTRQGFEEEATCVQGLDSRRCQEQSRRGHWGQRRCRGSEAPGREVAMEERRGCTGLLIVGVWCCGWRGGMALRRGEKRCCGGGRRGGWGRQWTELESRHPGCFWSPR